MGVRVHTDSATRMDASESESRPVGISLAVLADELDGTLHGAEHTRVVDVAQDSRRELRDTLFVALQGARADGCRYAPEAVTRGASAVLCEVGRAAELEPLGVPVIEVRGVRRAMARAAALVHGEPTRALRVVGITGTNGKTTTAHLVEAALIATGAVTGVVGTLGHRLGREVFGEGHTSPEADELQRLAALMRGRGASHLVMEVSSIALANERVSEVEFDVAAFTNLTQDHLDFHGSMEAYAASKERLFLEHRPRVSVVNVDDPYGAELADRIRDSGLALITVSARPDSDADLVPSRVEASPAGITLEFEDGASLRSMLVGNYNVSNLLVALGVVRALGLDPRSLEGLGDMRTVAGRLERCDEPGLDDIVVAVDYAHTPDALDRVLANIRGFTEGKLWCVFGCGGDRDPRKRAPMGEAVARAADVVVVTNDNPRGEDPEAIAKEILVGIERISTARRCVVELDRARAIRLAIEEASAGDVVLVAGKGHEPYQIIGARTLAFDDRVEARAALARRRDQSGGA